MTSRPTRQLHVIFWCHDWRESHDYQLVQWNLRLRYSVFSSTSTWALLDLPALVHTNPQRRTNMAGLTVVCLALVHFHGFLCFLPHFQIKYGWDGRSPITYCVQVSTHEYERQKMTDSQLALTDLLENIVKDKSMSQKDKKKRLKQVCISRMYKA